VKKICVKIAHILETEIVSVLITRNLVMSICPISGMREGRRMIMMNNPILDVGGVAVSEQSYARIKAVYDAIGKPVPDPLPAAEPPRASDANIREMKGCVIDDGGGKFHLGAWFWKPRPWVEDRDPDDAVGSVKDVNMLDEWEVKMLLDEIGGGLTPRQREVLVLRRRGNTERQIAQKLGVSHQAVDHIIRGIKNKSNKMFSKGPKVVAKPGICVEGYADEK